MKVSLLAQGLCKGPDPQLCRWTWGMRVLPELLGKL